MNAGSATISPCGSFITRRQFYPYPDPHFPTKLTLATTASSEATMIEKDLRMPAEGNGGQRCPLPDERHPVGQLL